MTKEIRKDHAEMPDTQKEVTIFDRFWHHLHEELEKIGLVKPEQFPDAETLPGEYPTDNLQTLTDASDKKTE